MNSPKKLSSLIALIDEGKTNFSVASQRIFPEMLTHPDKEPLKIAEELYEYVKNLLPDIKELTDKEYTLSDLKIDNLGNYGLTLKIIV